MLEINSFNITRDVPNFDFQNAVKLAEESNNWTQFAMNIIYPTIAIILILSVLIPTAIYFCKKWFGAKVEPTSVIKNWVSIFGSVIIVAVCYGILTAINQLMIKPQIEILKDVANNSTNTFQEAISTSGFVIANIVFSAIIGIAQLSLAITYIIWLSKRATGDVKKTGDLFKSLIWNVVILGSLVIVYFLINVGYNQYLSNILENLVTN